jgi:hypothetical protein
MTLCDAQGAADPGYTDRAVESKYNNRASEEANPQTSGDAVRLATFNQYRRLLFSVAYRMRTESRQ